MDRVATNMNSVASNMQTMTVAVTTQRQDISDLAANIRLMNQTMGNMTSTMHQMRFDTATMGRNIENVSGPMRFMNNFMPW
jgi:methyl-accepting chemotaxis protein